MIDSDNRNALDNYGVWVKKSPKDFSKDENDSIFNSNSSDDSQDSFEIAADLPDFSGLDNISSEDNAKDDAFDSGETSLTSEELLNITGSIAESSKNYEDITNFSATEEATDSISELSDSQISETASLADSDSEKIDLAFEDAEKAEGAGGGPAGCRHPGVRRQKRPADRGKSRFYRRFFTNLPG